MKGWAYRRLLRHRSREEGRTIQREERNVAEQILPVLTRREVTAGALRNSAPPPTVVT